MNVLLLEPGYHNKYPPLGLMKLSYYHKEYRGDFVWFQKGELTRAVTPLVATKLFMSKYYSSLSGGPRDCIGQANQVIAAKGWDRVYITTLFTFEWDRTIAAIEYAKTLVPKEKIYIGGVLATLMAEELEQATGIKPTLGLLTSSSMLGFDDDVCIDTLTPDYSILDNTEYSYLESNAYFVSCTKGCGMNCGFCAVQTLEPDYQPYIPIKDSINNIIKKYGERRHLVLMDNNLLKSPQFDKIIGDIIDVGFGRGATWVNPFTGKPNLRYLDVTQGLDANFLNDRKAKLLSLTAIKPVRIAFDHIDDKNAYVKAIWTAAENGINSVSNLMLYNTPPFMGKGKPRPADTPFDLYQRLKINVELANEIQQKRKQRNQPKFDLYSFPMQYIPLGAKKRDFLGDNWSPKTYQAVKQLVHLQQGVVYSKQAYFNNVWGRDRQEFSKRILAPRLFLNQCAVAGARLSSEGTRFKNFDEGQAWLNALKEWDRLYEQLTEPQKHQFQQLISCNKYSVKKYLELDSKPMRCLYIHYFTSISLVDFFEKLKEKNATLFREAAEYMSKEGKVVRNANILYMGKLIREQSHIQKLLSALRIDRPAKYKMNKTSS